MSINWSAIVVEREITYLLDPSCFSSWLRAQPPDRPLYDEEGGRCVLAVYLHDEGFSHPTVAHRNCYVDELEDLGPVDLPPWARVFVLDIDFGPATYRDEVVAVFEEALKDIADRDRPMTFEDWQTNKVVA